MNVSDIWQTINCELDETRELILDRLRDLLKNNCSKVRINLKDNTAYDVKRVNYLLSCLKVFGDDFCIMLDMPFPRRKCRIHLQKDLLVKRDDIIEIFDSSTSEKITADVDFFLENASIGEKYFVGDGEGLLQFQESKCNSIVFKAQNTFMLGRNKALSVSSLKTNIMNQEHVDIVLDWINEYNIKFLALSFVESKEDINSISRLNNIIAQKEINLIAKIENLNGINNISEILDTFDGAMIGRGDLALNIPLNKFVIAQNVVAQETRRNSKILLFATDILSSMESKSMPARSELVDYLTILACKPSGIVLKSNIYYNKRFSFVKQFVESV